MKSTINTQGELINQVLQQAVRENNFKQELINNPKAAIQNYYGYKVTDNVRLVVEDQSDNNTIYLNIPRQIHLEDLQLSEEELEKVSGGSTVWCGIGIGIAGAAIYDFVDGFIEGLTK